MRPIESLIIGSSQRLVYEEMGREFTENYGHIVFINLPLPDNAIDILQCFIGLGADQDS